MKNLKSVVLGALVALGITLGIALVATLLFLVRFGIPILLVLWLLHYLGVF